MSLSDEARQRFARFVDQTEPSDTGPADEAALLDFVAWALVHEPGALLESFALESMMSERPLTDLKIRSVLIILRAAAPLVAAYERELTGQTGTESPPGGRHADDDS